MSLKIKLGKAEHDALEESLKSLYVADGENFKLDADYEDVTGLKAKRDELLAKVSDLTKLTKQFEGLDPEKAREAVSKIGEIEDADLLNKRKYDELLQKRTGEWDAKEKGYQDKISQMVSRAARSELENQITKAGVKPSIAKGFVLELLDEHIQYGEEDGNVVWKSKDGLESVNLEKFLPELKNSKAGYFEPQTQGGGGATGSGDNAGSGKRITVDQYQANFAQYSEAVGKGEIQVVD